MDYAQWFSERVTQLRIEKGVSAREMSLALGQSESYINKIENQRTLPSMAGFFYICEYYGITPQEFFKAELTAPQTAKEIALAAAQLTPEQAHHVLQLVQDLGERR